MTAFIISLPVFAALFTRVIEPLETYETADPTDLR